MPTAHLIDRAVLHIDGADARPFLQGLLTNDLDQLSPERPLWAALLSPQGKVLFDMLLHDDGDGGVLLDCEAARADDLVRRLSMYRLRRAVTIARSDMAVFAAWNGADDLTPDPRLLALGNRAPAAPRLADAALGEYRAQRLALGVAEGAAELGIDQTLWLEANAAELNGVSFGKGCYVGQENTARMHYRANVRRRLLPVTLSATPGEVRAIMAGERAAGELRAWEGARGLAYLRLEYADGPLALEGAPVRLDWPAWLPRPEPAKPDAASATSPRATRSSAMDTQPHIENPEPQPTAERPNIADWRDHDRAGAGGATDSSPGDPGETLGTGNAREEDR